MKPLLVKESRPNPLKLPIPREKDDKDEEGRRDGLGDVMDSPRSGSSMSRGGSDGVRDLAERDGDADEEVEVAVDEELDVGGGVCGGEGGAAVDEEGETIDEEEPDELEDGVELFGEDDSRFRGEEGRSSDDVLSASRRCLCGLSVMDVNREEGSFPSMLGLNFAS